MPRYYTTPQYVVRALPRKMLHAFRKRPRLKRWPFNWCHLMVNRVVSARAAIDPKFRGMMRVALIESLEKDMTPEDRGIVRGMLAEEWGWPSGTA